MEKDIVYLAPFSFAALLHDTRPRQDLCTTCRRDDMPILYSFSLVWVVKVENHGKT